ncbi:MAG TPA: ABC transporter ATP-binding protein [Alphaproteobacteria bacterium]|jgi:branched-chain amino acid transport system ATP-binding protein|nr:ABC transporter ATP-binding protein [Alphaproteobacteria bacterium]
MTALLSIEGLVARYGPIEALKGVDLTVDEGEIVTLIGANGAGKSTLLMAISGVVRAAAGRIRFAGVDLRGTPPHMIARGGIAHVPEGRHVFPRMTVEENLNMGAMGAPADVNGDEMARAYELFPVLAERRRQRAGTLSGGEQQMLAIARALMARPRLLLLDEPSLGLAPLMVKRIFAAIQDINAERKTTVLLIEQNANQALRIASRAYVLAQGRMVLTGSSAELLHNPDVRAAYLEGGVTHEDRVSGVAPR